VLASGNFNELVTWGLASGKRLTPLLSGGRRLAFSPDGKLLAAVRLETVVLWDVVTGTRKGEFEGSPGFGVSCLACSRDGKLLATGGYDGAVRLWDVAAVLKARK
jgi:WD40 repeat protein